MKTNQSYEVLNWSSGRVKSKISNKFTRNKSTGIYWFIIYPEKAYNSFFHMTLLSVLHKLSLSMVLLK